jgi:hypothetical protein
MSLVKNEIPVGKPLEVGDKVKIVAIISEKILFVRRSDIDDSAHLTQIYRFSKNPEKLQMFPEVGDVALSEINGERCRVKVFRVADDQISVQLIDYGNTAVVKFEDLFEMPSQVQAIECTAFRVVLANVNVPAISLSVSGYLMELLNFKTELTVSMIDGDSVQLKEGTAENTSVNEEVVRCFEVPEELVHSGDALLKVS